MLAVRTTGTVEETHGVTIHEMSPWMACGSGWLVEELGMWEIEMYTHFPAPSRRSISAFQGCFSGLEHEKLKTSMDFAKVRFVVLQC